MVMDPVLRGAGEFNSRRLADVRCPSFSQHASLRERAPDDGGAHEQEYQAIAAKVAKADVFLSHPEPGE